MTDDLFDDAPVEGFDEEQYTPTESPKAKAARLREQTKREQAAAEALIARENLKAELRAELEAEIRSELLASTPEPVAEQVDQPQSDPAFKPVNFWSISPYHEPRILRQGSRSMIHFKNGFFRAETEADAQLIRSTILNFLAGEEDLPPNYTPRPDKDTGFAPRSSWAIEEFRNFRTMEIPTSMFGTE